MNRPRTIILLVIDCLRADHLHCYGYGRHTSPAIDALAESGVRFQACYPQGTYTFPSHVSLLTSIHHATHRLRNGDLLNYRVKTVADFLKEEGYDTAAFVSNGILAGDMGFRGHFDWYDDGLSQPGTADETFSRDAHSTARAVLEWLDNSEAKHRFLFVHFNDCHGPYLVPEPYRNLFAGDEWYRRKEILPIRSGERGVIMPRYAIGHRQEVDFYVSQYDAALRYIDDQIHGLCTALGRDTQPDDVLLIVTGDHGEGMGEHGIYFMHGNALYEEFIRVPLVIAGAGLPRHRCVDAPARHIDVLPTILDLAGVSGAPDHLHGQSLLPVIDGSPPGARDVFDVKRTAAYLREGEWKYIRTNDYARIPRKQGAAELKRRARQLLFRGREELYNLISDPGESRNLVRKEPHRAAHMRRRLDDLIARYASFDLSELPAAERPDADEEVIADRLRALGYLD